MARFYLKLRDTRPVLEVYLLDPDDTAHDLTSATDATLHIKLAGGTVLSKTMVIDGTPTTGIVRYTWLAADWDAGGLVEGTHRMEYEVQAGSSRLTFPNSGDDELIIRPDIGQAA
jgi:hypothetical protein